MGLQPPLFISLKNDEDKVSESFRQIELWSQQVTGGSGITRITSTGGSVTVTNPTGPTTNLEVASLSAYASLTGPGQTVTPGALTQAGDFTVNSTNQISLNTVQGNIDLKTTDAGGGDAHIQLHSTTGVISSILLQVDLGAGSTSSTIGIINTDYGGITLEASDSTGVGISRIQTVSGSTDVVTNYTQAWPTGSILTLMGGAGLFTASEPGTRIGCSDTTGTQHVAFSADYDHVSLATRLSFYGQYPTIARQSYAGVTTVAQLITILQNYGL